jgi:hypothetical protein
MQPGPFRPWLHVVSGSPKRRDLQSVQARRALLREVGTLVAEDSRRRWRNCIPHTPQKTRSGTKLGRTSSTKTHPDPLSRTMR